MQLFRTTKTSLLYEIAATDKKHKLPTCLVLFCYHNLVLRIYIEGKPTEEGTFTFTVHVENSAGFDEKQYTIEVKDEIVAPEIQMQMTVINDSYSKVNEYGQLAIVKGKEVDVQFYATGTNTSENPIKWSCNNVIVNGESKFYAHGESVTVTAEDKEGKVFKGWQDESGKIVSTEKSYTFTVNGDTTLTAVYEDKPSDGGEITPPAKKDGLSGGQIAGIVIGSVLLAGIGGFAIFWFAVKKKTFADLGIALKKGFTAIGDFFKTLGAKIKALFTKKK